MATHILYAEDEAFLGKIVKESLESRGFRVTMETDGDAVINAFMTQPADICVLDVMLPGKDGFAIAEEVRRQDPLVPIIFLTAKTQTEDLVKGFRSGGNDYIRKPFSMEELIVRIEYAVSKKGNAHTGKENTGNMRLGQYEFIPRQQVLRYGNTDKKLSFRETELLKLLSQRQDTIVERKDILQLLWGSDSFFNSRNLDVYIAKLRGYLKSDPSIEILTVKGIGYRFIVV